MRYLSLGAEVGNAGLSVVKHSLLEVPEVLVPMVADRHFYAWGRTRIGLMVVDPRN